MMKGEILNTQLIIKKLKLKNTFEYLVTMEYFLRIKKKLCKKNKEHGLANEKKHS